MPKKRFTDEQTAFALRQAGARTTVGEVCQTMGAWRTPLSTDVRRSIRRWAFSENRGRAWFGPD